MPFEFDDLVRITLDTIPSTKTVAVEHGLREYQMDCPIRYGGLDDNDLLAIAMCVEEEVNAPIPNAALFRASRDRSIYPCKLLGSFWIRRYIPAWIRFRIKGRLSAERSPVAPTFGDFFCNIGLAIKAAEEECTRTITERPP